MEIKHRLTKEWYEKLKNELYELKEIELPKVLEILKDAIAQWDISENAEYDAAMERKNQIEIRIAQIEEILSNFEIITESSWVIVDYGSKVKIKDDKWRIYEVIVVWSNEVDPDKNMFSLESPIWKAIAWKKKGDKVYVKAPRWRYQIEILEVN